MPNRHRSTEPSSVIRMPSLRSHRLKPENGRIIIENQSTPWSAYGDLQKLRTMRNDTRDPSSSKTPECMGSIWNATRIDMHCGRRDRHDCRIDIGDKCKGTTQ